MEERRRLLDAMIQSTLSYFRRRGKALGSSLLILSLAGTSFLLTSCTTEEGVIAGALAGAAVGGLVGHSQETAYKRHRRAYNRYDYGDRYYDNGYRYGGRQRYSSYRGGGYRDDYCY